jgi:hypothetical protein
VGGARVPGGACVPGGAIVPEPDDRVAWARAARGGLCAICAFAALVPTPSGSLFLRCRHVSMPKYPTMPVRRCAAFAARAHAPHEGAAPDET